MAAGPGAPSSPSPMNSPGALPTLGSSNDGSLTLDITRMNDTSPAREFDHGRTASIGR